MAGYSSGEHVYVGLQGAPLPEGMGASNSMQGRGGHGCRRTLLILFVALGASLLLAAFLTLFIVSALFYSSVLLANSGQHASLPPTTPKYDSANAASGIIYGMELPWLFSPLEVAQKSGAADANAGRLELQNEDAKPEPSTREEASPDPVEPSFEVSDYLQEGDLWEGITAELDLQSPPSGTPLWEEGDDGIVDDTGYPQLEEEAGVVAGDLELGPPTSPSVSLIQLLIFLLSPHQYRRALSSFGSFAALDASRTSTSYGTYRVLCIPAASEYLEQQEGRHDCAYDSSGGFRAVGVGYNLDEDPDRRKLELTTVGANYDKVYEGEECLNDLQVNALLLLTSKRLLDKAAEMGPTPIDSLCCDLQKVLADIALTTYNDDAGEVWCKDLEQFVEKISVFKWEQAAKALQESDWCKDHKKRCEEAVKMVENGCSTVTSGGWGNRKLLA